MSSRPTPLRRNARTAAEAPPLPAGPQAARLVRIDAGGVLVAALADGRELACDWLTTSAGPAPELAAGDTLLLLPLPGAERPVVLGRIGRLPLPGEALVQHMVLAASGTLTLRCGESSVDLRADGKLMIRGDDVLVRAKGTQRIRAGTVAIN
jgi:hypothetical protein